ncbi:MAG: GHKL domain-containing protein [Bacteroidales bacterium]|nr:GHKL domain-containing protein [Bacteroidales bacterium]MCF8459018.1 GHKL domain-containing protein [Bacteroidales bacterium]
MEDKSKKTREELVEEILRLKKINSTLLLGKDDGILLKIVQNLPGSYISIIEKDLTVGFAAGQEFTKQGLNPNSFIGSSLQDIFGEHAPKVKEHYMLTFNGQETSFELLINNQHQLYKAVPLSKSNGEIDRILVVVENITQQKKTKDELLKYQTKLQNLVEERTKEIEEKNKRLKDTQKALQSLLEDNLETANELNKANSDLAEANTELESFAYSISHDLRAPLRHIDGFARILKNKITDPSVEIETYYEKINSAVSKMSTMIDSLLSLSRLGRRELQKIQIDTKQLVQIVIDRLKVDCNNSAMELKISDLPVILADPMLIQMAFENLISNSIKFSSKNENTIIEIGYNESSREIFVKDNGVGFKMEHAGKLFGVFQRLHTQEEFEGTGIGLANVKQIVKKHGGTVRAESEINKGATFFIYLPN